ncbi:hypothetical protein ACHAWF_011053 [Thalassiosira exigua]
MPGAILPTTTPPQSGPKSSNGALSGAASSAPGAGNAVKSKPIKRKTNRLFVIFAVLAFVVAGINVHFHHRFHDEHVLDKSHREFQRFFKTNRQEAPLVDDYVLKRKSLVEEGENGNVGVEGAGGGHKLAGLRCKEEHGGPEDDYADKEMVFWSDIPSDASYKSPFMDETERFLTFEPDHGGWNNIRMAMETALVMSHAMGRTLVLPPEQRFYLLGKSNSNQKIDLLGKGIQNQKTDFDFGDFFHLDSIALEHEGFNVISSEEFLNRLGKTGKLLNAETGKLELWNDKMRATPSEVHNYLRKVGVNPYWDPMKCIAGFPSRKGTGAIEELRQVHADMMAEKGGRKRPTLAEFEGKPVPVDAPVEERMREAMGERTELCIYDEKLQQAQVVHFPAQKGTRLLTHFYAFVFFADWRADLWSKRFVRDHLRYIDHIMCAAARVVEAVRKRSKDKDGLFDSMHVRRGDFQYKKTRLEAEKLLKISKDKLEEGGLLFIATDERDKSFFQPFREHYDVVFLDDFKDLLEGINTNFYGMLDQLVASKGRVFFGTWWSTLSGYVNRMRGYYIAKHKLEGWQDGSMNSYYFFPHEKTNQMKQYMPVKKPIYMREFPTSWRDIDKGVED